MPVTNDQVSALRALLSGNLEMYRDHLAQLDQEAAGSGLTSLITAAFLEAVERRFKGASDSEIIHFVANLRSVSPQVAADLDPRIAERVIKAVLTGESVSDIDDAIMMGTQFLLLNGLVRDEQLDDDTLDRVVASARELADYQLDRP